MVHDSPAGAVPVGVSRRIGFLAGSTHSAPATTRRRPRPRALLLLGLALALTHAPAVAVAQVTASRPVDGPRAPRSLPAGRGDAAVFTIERLIDQGRLDEARVKMREQSAAHGVSPRLLFLEAMVLYQEGQYIESVRQLERSLALSDRDPDVHKLVGLNLVAAGRRDLAGPYFETAVELAPRDFMARYYLGLHELSDRRHERAAAMLREAVALEPGYVDAHLLLGVAEEQRGNEDEALRIYRHAIDLVERQGLKSDGPFLYLARLLISLQRHEQSLLPLRRAVELDAASSQARALLGQALTHLGRYDEALPVLRAAATLAPGDKTPHFLLMTVYRRLGRHDDAARERQLFLALDERDGSSRTPQDSGSTYGRRSDVR